MRVISTGRRDPVHRLAFADDGRFLAAASGTTFGHRGVEVYAPTDPAAPPVKLHVVPAEPFFRFLPGRCVLAVADSYVVGFDLSGPEPRAANLTPETIYPVGGFDVSADGRRLIVCRTKPYTIIGQAGYLAFALDPPAGEGARVWAKTLAHSRETVADGIAFVAGDDGSRVEPVPQAVGFERFATIVNRDESGTVVAVHDWAARKRVFDLGRGDRAEMVQLAADRRLGRVAVRCEDRILVWDRVEPKVAPREIAGEFAAIAFAPAGTHLAAAATDGTLTLFDAATGVADKTFAWGAGGLRCVAFSADGTLGAAGTATGQIVVWDADP